MRILVPTYWQKTDCENPPGASVIAWSELTEFGQMSRCLGYFPWSCGTVTFALAVALLPLVSVAE